MAAAAVQAIPRKLTLADIDMHGFGVAIAADAADRVERASVARNIARSNAGNLHVSGKALHMKGMAGAAGAAIFTG